MTRHRNFGCRLRDFTWRDHRCITMENEIVRILIAADKGADILEFLHKPTDTECLWQSPSGLRPRAFQPSTPLDTGPFREYFAGGWYEMLPNGPGPCEHRGAKFGYHGEATLLPWEVSIETDDPECVRVRFSTRLSRIPLHAAKIMELRRGIPTMTLTETISSEAGQSVEFLWGHHPTFGAPLLEPGTRILLPNREFTVPSHDARSHDFVRIDDMPTGWYAIHNPTRDMGFSLGYDHKLFPVLGYWQLFHGGPDYPWYCSHFLAALEPASDLPSLADAAKRGTAITLDPGQSISTIFQATAFSGAFKP